MKQSSRSYVLRVKDYLDPGWSERLEGMRITHVGGETELAGDLPDQAALHGVLATIRDLGLVLISVRQIEANDLPADHESGESDALL